ncbi:MAG: hypothetical protein ACI4CS_11955, partial [Candidatus Weimeria sp.]
AQYYLCDDTKLTRTYITDRSLVDKLISKDYYSRLLSSAQRELKQIVRFLKGNPATTVEEVYRQLPELKRELVRPFCVDDDTYAQLWASEKYTSLEMKTDENYSSDGVNRYRSKSEFLIATALTNAGVPFKYECRLELKGYGPAYPDFTVLNKRTRQVYYHEHMGMIGDGDYTLKNLKKINAYERNGFMQGKKLIVTYESDQVHLDMNIVKNIIEEFYL